MTNRKTYIYVPYDERDEAKAAGAKWDNKLSMWYIPEDLPLERFTQWHRPLIDGDAWLDVPYRARERAKALGARWNPQAKSWYCPNGCDIMLFREWAFRSDIKRRPDPDEVEVVPFEIADVPPPKQIDFAINGCAPEDIWLDVPFQEKDEAKRLGAQFDWDMKHWYVPEGTNLDPFKRWRVPDIIDLDNLSDEQKHVLELVASGRDVHVEACVGSGKTTTLQAICHANKGLRILYLTYNRLLKSDARQRIILPGVEVDNYHAFARRMLQTIHISVAPQEMIREFLHQSSNIDMGGYDIILIDEYQDLTEELADMLIRITQANLDAQFIVVGDECQKIYDNTRLNTKNFIRRFLDNPYTMTFTESFRLPKNLAHELSLTWGKDINGTNDECVATLIPYEQVVDYLSQAEPSQVLCLGSRTGRMPAVMNELEKRFPDKYNKNTLYASIKDTDTAIAAPATAAIFTTFDGCKGLERDICVVFDFTRQYWMQRLSFQSISPTVMRNIFCVAASRGKRRILFVDYGRNGNLSFADIRDTLKNKNIATQKSTPIAMSEAFDFKYQEDVEAAYNLLRVKCLNHGSKESVIPITRKDGLIDLSPCAGILMEASYFDNYDIDSQILWSQQMHPDRPPIAVDKNDTLEEKVLALTAFETMHQRYIDQVSVTLANDVQLKQLHSRLDERFTPDEDVQVSCHLIGRDGAEEAILEGRCDVLRDDAVWELKFVSELSHSHFLQCALYMLSLKRDKGILWNVRDDERWEIRISNKKAFKEAVFKCVTRGRMFGD